MSLDAYVDRLVEDFARRRVPHRLGRRQRRRRAERSRSWSQRLPGEHHAIFTEVDGTFPNHHPDPTVEANLADLKALVADKQLDFGIAFDGDGDRIGAVDGEGRVIWGDQLLMILAEPVLEGAARARRSSPTSRPARPCSTASPNWAASR